MLELALALVLWTAANTSPGTDYSRPSLDSRARPVLERSARPVALGITDAALLMSDLAGGQIPIAIAVSRSPIDSQLLVVVEVDLEPVSNSRFLDLVLYILDRENRIVAHQSFGLLPVSGEKPDTSEVDNEVRAVALFDVDPGHATIRALVRDHDGDDFGVTGLQIAPSADAWITVPADSRWGIFDSAATLEADDLRFAPTARRTFDINDEVVVAGLIPRNSVPQENAKTEPPALSISECRAFEADIDLCRWVVQTTPPPTTSSELELRLEPASITITLTNSNPPTRKAASPPSTENSRRLTRAGIRDRLLVVLRSLVSNLDQDALDLLVAIDTDLHESPARHVLQNVEHELAASMADEQCAAFLPFALFRWRLSQRYRAEHSAVLAERSMNLAVDLATYIARNDPHSDARTDAALLLTEIAGALHRRGRSPESDELYVRALNAAPENTHILLGAAINAEQLANYELAVARLLRLEGSSGGQDEGRLRLAINLGRTGDHARSRELLDELVDAPSTEHWVAVVAAEQLVRSALRDDELDRAEALLKVASSRFTDEPSIQLLAAYRETRVRSRLESSAHTRQFSRPTAHLDGVVNSDRPIPRARYGEWPKNKRYESLLTERIAARRAMLAKWLDRGQPGAE